MYNFMKYTNILIVFFLLLACQSPTYSTPDFPTLSKHCSVTEKAGDTIYGGEQSALAAREYRCGNATKLIIANLENPRAADKRFAQSKVVTENIDVKFNYTYRECNQTEVQYLRLYQDNNSRDKTNEFLTFQHDNRFIQLQSTSQNSRFHDVRNQLQLYCT